MEGRWQARFGELGIVSVPLFAGLDETREKIRAALAADLPLNFEESVAKRLEMARLLSAWEAVKLHLEVSEKNRAESRIGDSAKARSTKRAAWHEGGCGGHSWQA